MVDKKRPTDFNDLHLEQGLQAVKAQLEAAVTQTNFGMVSPGPPSASELEPPGYISDIPDEYESPAPSGGCVGSDEQLLDESGRYTLQALIKHFWFIWGTDTAWDNVNRRQIRLSHLRHGVGRERYKAWEDSFARHWVKDILFEPGKDLGARSVNLYDGIKMKPDPRGTNGCDRIRHHIFRLCNFRDDEFEWLMKWIAYPLQHPGAKMASSVIMYGSEGPGKSIIWEEVVKKIYGEYGVTIGQAQLESQFTGWRSRRLFALAEEVVSRSERNHHKGQLKQLVTGATSMINEKMLPEREESNHMNFVFLSNSTVPLELDMGDRRYMVLYVDKVPEPGYFDDLFEEIETGGVECFYQHLLKMDLTGFSPHTKPPKNQEKDDLIDASLPSPVYFQKLWKEGELDIPYKSAVSGDLYRAFQRWCERNGEFKRTDRYFGAELKRVMPQVRKNIRYPDEMSSHSTKRIYVTEDDLKLQHEPDYVDRLAASCREFLASENSRAASAVRDH